MKNKYMTAFISLFFWWFWLHKFYLWLTLQGFVYLIFFWTCIPLILSFFEFIYFLIIPEKEFNIKYNYDYIKRQKELNDLELNK